MHLQFHRSATSPPGFVFSNHSRPPIAYLPSDQEANNLPPSTIRHRVPFRPPRRLFRVLSSLFALATHSCPYQITAIPPTTRTNSCSPTWEFKDPSSIIHHPSLLLPHLLSSLELAPSAQALTRSTPSLDKNPSRPHRSEPDWGPVSSFRYFSMVALSPQLSRASHAPTLKPYHHTMIQPTLLTSPVWPEPATNQ